MKKRTMIILLVLVCAASVFAATNGQTIYSVDNSIYKKIETLYIAQGYGAPSSSGPWSGNELLHMMDKISKEELSTTLQKVYDEVIAELNPEANLDFDTVAFNVSGEADLELYFRKQGNKGTLAATTLGEALTTIMKASGGDPESMNLVEEAIKTYNSLITSKDPIIDGFLAKYELDAAELTLEALTDLQEPEKLAAFANFNDFEDYALQANSFDQVDAWFHGYQYRKPIVKVNFETWALDKFYGYFGLGLGETDFPYLYGLKFNTNATLLTGVLYKSGVADLDAGLGKRLGTSNIFGEPMKAVASFGGDRWNVVAGRDRLSWGLGETGNLMLSDSFPQHTFAKFTTYHNVFKYSLLGTIYPFYNDYHSKGAASLVSKPNGYGQGDAIDGYKSLIAHRLEFSFWKNRVNLAVTEACMFRKPGITEGEQVDGFTLAMINPFGFMHNEYNRINGNSLLVFEADITPIKGLNVYAQYALDDFAIPGQSDDQVPAATGFLAGVKGVYEVADGILKLNAEYVKTDPFLYLRGAYEDVAPETGAYGSSSEYSYGYGYDALYRHFSVGLELITENKFITYKYGNDVKVFQIKAAYEMPNVFEAGFGVFTKTSGVMDITSPWGIYNKFKDSNGNVKDDYTNNAKVKTPALVDPFKDGSGAKEPGEDVAAEKMTVVTLSGVYHTPVENLDAYVYADFISYKNFNCKKDAKYKDVQATFGAKYSF